MYECDGVYCNKGYPSTVFSKNVWFICNQIFI